MRYGHYRYKIRRLAHQFSIFKPSLQVKYLYNIKYSGVSERKTLWEYLFSLQNTNEVLYPQYCYLLNQNEQPIILVILTSVNQYMNPIPTFFFKDLILRSIYTQLLFLIPNFLQKLSISTKNTVTLSLSISRVICLKTKNQNNKLI